MDTSKVLFGGLILAILGIGIQMLAEGVKELTDYAIYILGYISMAVGALLLFVGMACFEETKVNKESGS